jgi:DHA1 family bicyclomycin/chloramphenicol resistance-like MFS transporter
MFGLVVAQLVLGPLSDRLGRRSVLLPSLALYTAMSVLCAVAPNFEVLVVGRFLQACGAAGTSAVVRAAIHDAHRGDAAARLMTVVAVGHSVAHTLSPTIGGLVGEAADVAGTFALMGALGIAMLAWAALRMPETLTVSSAPVSAAGLIRDTGAVLRNPLFQAYAAIYGLTGSGFFAFLAVAPAYFDAAFGISGAAFGLYWSYMAMAFMGAALAGGRLVTRFGRRTMFNTCLGSCAVLGAALPMVVVLIGATPATIVAPMVVASGFLGITSPLSLSGAIAAEPDRAGAASGLCGAVAMAYAGLFTILGGLIYDGTALTLVLPMTMTLVLMALAAVAIARLERSG